MVENSKGAKLTEKKLERHSHHPTHDFSQSGFDLLPRIYDERNKKPGNYSFVGEMNDDLTLGADDDDKDYR